MCGIFGVTGHPEASNLTYLGLYALQHRGQEGAGIVSTDGTKLFKRMKKRLVSDTFTNQSFEYLKGDKAIGHVRYSTAGSSTQRNLQPFTASGNFGHLAVAHNGNLTNFLTIRKNLETEGSLFQSTADTEVMLHLVSRAKGKTLESKVMEGLKSVRGAYSVLFMNQDTMIAARDPMGFRPLLMGNLNGAKVFASESCAFDLIGAELERDIEPGEVVTVRSGKTYSSSLNGGTRTAQCVFEHIYFARPDSRIFNSSVYDIRNRLGAELAKEAPVEADLVTPVPDSGVITALGFASELGIPMEMGFIRNHYVGRTFIEPRQSIRNFGVKIKLNPVRQVLRGKRVAVVDDSIVRGTTSKKIIKMIRDAGAKEVFLYIASPPVTGPCRYGIDTPTKDELIASQKSIDEIREYVGADQLHYLSMDGVYRAVGSDSASKYCDACFTGNYFD